MPGFNVADGKDRSQPSSTIETHRSHRWRINRLVNTGDGPDLFSQDLRIYAKSVSLPSFSADEEIVLGGSITYKFAKGINFEDVKVTFYDVFGILDAIKKSMATVWSTEKGLGTAAKYKGISEFQLLNSDGDPTYAFILKNSWIKNVTHSDLSFDSSSIKEVTLTISYDWAEEDGSFTSAPSASAPGKPTGSKAKGDHSPGQKEPSRGVDLMDQKIQDLLFKGL